MPARTPQPARSPARWWCSRASRSGRTRPGSPARRPHPRRPARSGWRTAPASGNGDTACRPGCSPARAAPRHRPDRPGATRAWRTSRRRQSRPASAGRGSAAAACAVCRTRQDTLARSMRRVFMSMDVSAWQGRAPSGAMRAQRASERQSRCRTHATRERGRNYESTTIQQGRGAFPLRPAADTRVARNVARISIAFMIPQRQTQRSAICRLPSGNAVLPSLHGYGIIDVAARDHQGTNRFSGRIFLVRPPGRSIRHTRRSAARRLLRDSVTPLFQAENKCARLSNPYDPQDCPVLRHAACRRRRHGRRQPPPRPLRCAPKPPGRSRST